MTSRRVPACLAICAVASGCGRYADFRLPELSLAQPKASYVWEPRAEPVLRRGVPGEWDSHDVLNPSVVLHGGTYYNFYSGFDGQT
jgi:hypothetical protein